MVWDGRNAAYEQSLIDAWVPYAATWTGSTTNPTNYVSDSAYLLLGKTLIVRGKVTANASGFTVGSGNYSVSLPPFNAAAVTIGAIVEYFDSNPGPIYRGSGRINAGTQTLNLYCDPTTAGGALRTVTPTIPYTWAASDVIRWEVEYQIV